MEFILYILKVNVAIILFYGIYLILFRQDTFFQWKRIALLSIVCMAFLYPFIDISRQLTGHTNWKDIMENGFFPSYYLQEVSVTGNAHPSGMQLPQLLFTVYISVVCLLLIRLLMQIGTIRHNLRNTTKTTLFGQTVYKSPGLKTPFSFFRWIVLDAAQYSETELHEILLHEATHVEQGHSVDTILAELLCVSCWFNPFAWLLKKEIRLNLEFLADRSVLASGCGAEHYQFHLLRLSYHKAAAQLSNNFNVSPLKKRIFMMNKKQTPHRSMLKYALILPVVTMLVFFNCTFSKAQPENDTVQTAPQDSVDVQKQLQELLTGKIQKVIYSQAEDMPEFPGGDKALMKYLGENIQYPADAINRNIDGRVITRFVIESDGSIADVEIIRSVDPVLDEEALRVVKNMPKWKPGKQNGKTVAVYYTLPVMFKLSNGSSAQPAEKVDISNISADDVVFVVDGKTISKEEFAKIDANSIERVDVIKDEQPNKVVITTKK